MGNPTNGRMGNGIAGHAGNQKWAITLAVEVAENTVGVEKVVDELAVPAE